MSLFPVIKNIVLLLMILIFVDIFSGQKRSRHLKQVPLECSNDMCKSHGPKDISTQNAIA